MDLINIFQEEMKKNGYTAYLITSSDFHNSEYVSDYFKSRAYLSGFTGSAGSLLITTSEAYLWTDGRYYIQAQKQIEGRPIKLMKQGQPDVPSIIDFLATTLTNDDTLAFDGRTIPTSFIFELKAKLTQKPKIVSNNDLVNKIWKNRPNLPFSIIYKLDCFYAGRDYKSKLAELKELMNEKKVDMYIMSSLEDQAWLYNLRGKDVSYTPVFLAYTIINEDHNILFTDQNKVDLTIEKYLDENDITLDSYNGLYDYLSQIKNKTILIDPAKINYQIYSLIEQNNKIVTSPDLTLLPKSIKNETEIKNIKEAHIKDGVAMTKFMYYLKKNHSNGNDMTELSVSNYLGRLRQKTKGFIDLSFATIAAFNDHAAMMHYCATPETSASLAKDGLLLVDSGGHYLEGTTDITRTYALGEIGKKRKKHFTLVLKSLIGLSNAVFLKGCTGQNLDILARGPIWKELIDYKCGTGHGVGYLLSVHEAPNGFRWQKVPERNDSAILVPGMVTTNEPGIYIENEYGIRIENEMLCVEKGKSEFGEFYGFETITFAPIDLDAITVSLLNKEEKEWLNNYHRSVYEKISPYLTEEENEWLKNYTRSI